MATRTKLAHNVKARRLVVLTNLKKRANNQEAAEKTREKNQQEFDRLSVKWHL